METKAKRKRKFIVIIQFTGVFLKQIDACMNYEAMVKKIVPLKPEGWNETKDKIFQVELKDGKPHTLQLEPEGRLVIQQFHL